jgi:hypothetical protein
VQAVGLRLQYFTSRLDKELRATSFLSFKDFKIIHGITGLETEPCDHYMRVLFLYVNAETCQLPLMKLKLNSLQICYSVLIYLRLFWITDELP